MNRRYFLAQLARAFTALGVAFLAFCAAFSRAVNDRSARHLLLASVIYLPGVLAAMALDRLV